MSVFDFNQRAWDRLVESGLTLLSFLLEVTPQELLRLLIYLSLMIIKFLLNSNPFMMKQAE